MTEPAIELRGVTKRYRDFVLQDVDLRLEPGQIMGFVGPNGAGKSTTIRILMGLIHQDSGECRVLGHAMPAEQIAAKRQIGFVSEDMRLYPRATLAWHMRFLARIYPAWDAAYAHSLLRRFELRADQILRRYSRGERIKAMLLLALARRPRLLVLDEPTAGLDPVARHEALGEFMNLLREDDRTILFSTHNTRDVEQIADQIAFIDRGRVIDVADKETFLDRWRRIRLELPSDAALPRIDAVIDVQRDGRQAVAIVRGYEPGIEQRLGETGARVQRVEAMSLEEIFIATVLYGRQRMSA
jgi:ABC-2 type transport system ATP-binding protein